MSGAYRIKPDHLAKCQGKTIWATWSVAERQARKMRRKYREALHVYRCDTCRGFHVGHSSGLEREED